MIHEPLHYVADIVLSLVPILVFTLFQVQTIPRKLKSNPKEDLSLIPLRKLQCAFGNNES